MKSGSGVIYRPLIAFVLAICLFGINATPVSALNISDYMNIDYIVVFSQDKITPVDSSFYMKVTGTAACNANLPLDVTEGYTTGYVVARHVETGSEVILNPGYTMVINPFPSRSGETIYATVDVALFFPKGSQIGAYKIYGVLVEARVKAVLWFTVTSYLPQTQLLGTVSYIPESTTTGTTATHTITTTTSSTQTTTSTKTTAITQTTTAPQTDTTGTIQTGTSENPANFIISNLRISPDRVDLMDRTDYITITVRVSNSGGSHGICELYLQINGKVTEIKDIALFRGEDGYVVFSLSIPEAGTYKIDVNGLTGTLTVTDNHISTINNTVQNTTATSITVINTTETTIKTGELDITKTVVNTQYHSRIETDTQQTGNIGQTSAHSGTGITGDNEKGDTDTLWWLLFIILAADLGLICVLQLSTNRKRKTVANKIKDKQKQDPGEYKIHLK